MITELRDVERELGRFRGRLLAAALAVFVAFALLGARMVYLQVYQHQELATQAENNRIAIVPIVPNRGLILDRNGVVLASNYSAYTLEIMPSKVSDLDATIDALAKIVDIGPRDRRRFKRALDESKSVESLPLRTKLSDEEVARFTAQRSANAGRELFHVKGFDQVIVSPHVQALHPIGQRVARRDDDHGHPHLAPAQGRQHRVPRHARQASVKQHALVVVRLQSGVG